VESIQNAAQLCTNCTPEVAATAPLMEAMVTQAEALQEMLGAQTDVVVESVEGGEFSGEALVAGLEELV